MKKQGLFLTVFLFISTFSLINLSAAVGNSTDNPVIYMTTSGAGGTAAPFIFVKNTGLQSFKADIFGGDQQKNYNFEDWNDNDYNDVLTEVKVLGNASQDLRILVSILGIDADYDHEVWIRLTIPAGYKAVFGGVEYTQSSVDIRVFESTKVPLPVSSEIQILPLISDDGRFTLSVSPGVIDLPQGDECSFEVLIECGKNFSGKINLSHDGFPPDLDASFAEQRITGRPGKTVKTTLNVKSRTESKTGRYQFKVRGSSDGIAAEDTAVLKVIELTDFMIIAAPGSARVYPGESVDFNLTVKPLGSFNDDVILSPGTLPPGVTGRIEPVTIGINGKAILKINIAVDTAVGEYLIPVSGKSGDLEHTTRINLVVQDKITDVEIIKTANKNKVVPGETVQFTITVSNPTDTILKDILVSDRLHDALLFVSSDIKPEIKGQDIAFKLNELGASSTGKIKFTVRIKDDIDPGVRITNYAVVSGGQIETKKSNTVVLESGIPSLSLTKNIRNMNPNYRPGGIVIYELSISNNGSSPVYDLKITDTLPQGFYPVPGRTLVNGRIAEDPRRNGSQVLWEMNELEAGSRLSIIYQVSISSSVKNGRHINEAEILARDGSGRELHAGPAQAIVTVSRGAVLLWSSLEGVVFEDNDGDGVYGADDTPLEGLELILETGERTRSNSQGVFLFEQILPGEHVLSIDDRFLPEYLEPAENAYLINLMEGAREYRDFPILVRNEGKIKGKITWKEQPEYQEVLTFDGIQVLLDGKYYVKSSTEGLFEFNNVPAGDHGLSLLSETLPQGLDSATGLQIEVTVKQRETAEVSFELQGNPYGTLAVSIISRMKNSAGETRNIPIDGIGISLINNRSGFTDISGQFSFADLLPGEYPVSVDENALRIKNFKLDPDQQAVAVVKAGKITSLQIVVLPMAYLEVEINK